MAGKGATIHGLLVQTAQPERVEWMLNFTRQKASLDVVKSEKTLLPYGTTSNEALRGELNRWFRGINALRQTSLALKLRIFRFGKLVSHNVALYRATTVQVRGCVLGRWP